LLFFSPKNFPATIEQKLAEKIDRIMTLALGRLVTEEIKPNLCSAIQSELENLKEILVCVLTAAYLNLIPDAQTEAFLDELFMDSFAV